MCTKLVFFSTLFDFWDFVDLIDPYDARWFPETFRVSCGRFPTLGSVQNTFRVILPSKNIDFRLKIYWFPQLDPRTDLKLNLWWNQWFSTVRGSSVGNRCSSSTENIQKLHFWVCKSSPGHPGVSRSRNIPKFLNVHILYKSFKSTVDLSDFGPQGIWNSRLRWVST